jgi:SMC interacting uncharacterized protein involved in chromosome segregation
LLKSHEKCYIFVSDCFFLNCMSLSSAKYFQQSVPENVQDSSVEQLKSENADLLGRLSTMKEALLAKELLIETLQKEKSDLEVQLSSVF